MRRRMNGIFHSKSKGWTNAFLLVLSMLLPFACATPQTHKEELPKRDNLYMHIYGTTQGDFTGGSSGDWKGWSECVAYDYVASGLTIQSLVKGFHMFLRVYKKVDTASPQFLRARKAKEILNVEFEFATTTKEGKDYVFQKIKLINAKVDNVYFASKQVEYIDFAAERIEFSHVKGSQLWWNPGMTYGEQGKCRAPKQLLENFCQ